MKTDRARGCQMRVWPSRARMIEVNPNATATARMVHSSRQVTGVMTEIRMGTVAPIRKATPAPSATLDRTGHGRRLTEAVDLGLGAEAVGGVQLLSDPLRNGRGDAATLVVGGDFGDLFSGPERQATLFLRGDEELGVPVSQARAQHHAGNR